jgi:hypothetical protein
MCIFSEDMDKGDYNDDQSKCLHRTSRNKFLSSVWILGLDNGFLHWEMQRSLIHDAITLVHYLKHNLYVVNYGDKLLSGETLSRVEKCVPCLLHCKKRIIDKVVRMFLLKAQKQSTKDSKATSLRRVMVL